MDYLYFLSKLQRSRKWLNDKIDVYLKMNNYQANSGENNNGYNEKLEAINEQLPSYVNIYDGEDHWSITFQNEDEKPYRVGQKMEEINPEAYMNGYNWEIFLTYYLTKYEPQLKIDLDHDPEAGSYFAYYPRTDECLIRAKNYCELIAELIENEEKILQIVRNEGDIIEWD